MSPARVIEAPRLVVPADLLACTPQPEPPAMKDNAADSAAVGYFLADLAAAGDDCRSKLAAVKTIVAP